MRILYVTAHYPPDFVSGATLQIRRLAQHVGGLGHDVRVLSGSIRPGLDDGQTRDELVEGVPVRWLGTAQRIDERFDDNWVNEGARTAAVELIDDFGPDVVHAHAMQTLGPGPLEVAADRSIPTFLTMHDLWWWCARLFLVDQDLHPCPRDTRTSRCPCARSATWRRTRAATLSRALSRVDHVLVPSRSLRSIVIANGLRPDRVEVDENDVERTPIRLDENRRQPSRRRTVRFLYVGGEHPLKGCDVLLDAAQRVRRRSWRLAMYGVRPRWRRRPWRRARQWRIRFRSAYEPGATAEVMNDADVLIIPSIARESFSLVAREALAAGLAVITSDCLGPEEVVHEERNGVIVPTGDADALAGAMGRLVAQRGVLERLQRGALDDPPTLRDPGEHAASLVARYAQARQR